MAVAVTPDWSPGEVTVTSIFPGEMDFLDGLAADVDDNLYVVVAGASRVVRLGPDGTTELVELYVTSLSPPDLVAEPSRGPLTVSV